MDDRGRVGVEGALPRVGRRSTKIWYATGFFLLGNVWHHYVAEDGPKKEVKTVTREHRVEVPVPSPYPVPAPAPTVTRLETPQACDRVVTVLDQWVGRMKASEKVGNELLPVLDSAGIHIAEGDVSAIAEDIAKAADIKDRLGTANIKELEAIESLTDALNECRQEKTP